ncbi:DUF6168 family protein [Allomuricauda sp. d1]|uniref:DUF6168 family protein n=1 Tax=Allomuricauda sp. d1 TaxID=3136725 RepID=UPI0031CFF490
MSKLPLQFTMALLAALSTAFAFHILVLFLLDYPLWGDLLPLSYLINFLLAVGIFFGLYALRKKLSNSLGFLFMAGSLLKFAVFFLVFYPAYKSDAVIQRSEFAAFFVPYLIALVQETFFASKMLQKLDKKPE